VTRFQVDPPEKTTFHSYGPVISPDGEALPPWSSALTELRQLWIRDLDSLTGRILPGPPDQVGTRFGHPTAARSASYPAGS